jgi:hypothetical protein
VKAKRRRRRRLPTTRAQLLQLHAELLGRARRIIVAKNAAYGLDADALANFRAGDLVGVRTPQAVFCRLSDKFLRLALAARGRRLNVEGNDVPDAINLLVLPAAALREARPRRRRRKARS